MNTVDRLVVLKAETLDIKQEIKSENVDNIECHCDCDFHLNTAHSTYEQALCPVSAVKQEDLTCEHLRDDVKQEVLDSTDPEYSLNCKENIPDLAITTAPDDVIVSKVTENSEYWLSFQVILCSIIINCIFTQANGGGQLY